MSRTRLFLFALILAGCSPYWPTVNSGLEFEDIDEEAFPVVQHFHAELEQMPVDTILTIQMFNDTGEAEAVDYIVTEHDAYSSTLILTNPWDHPVHIEYGGLA